MRSITIAILMLAITAAGAAERINHEGRILGAAPTVSTPTLFNTAQADAIVSAMQIFPVTSAWNEDISQRPLLGGNNANSAPSDAIIATIKNDMVASHRVLQAEMEMNYVLVPDNQPSDININFTGYPDESDLNGGTLPIGKWPIPTIMPIETWPVGTGSLTLQQWQQNINGVDEDRHSIVVQPGIGKIFETWEAVLTTNTPAWEASNGCIFDLTSNTLRPDGFTSGDAAGLPLFPALVRYDEAERGFVEHALRIVVKHSRATHIYPATHDASRNPTTSDPTVPAMGQRLRLKSSFAVPGTWSKEEKAIAYALKKYGALVADNGNYFSISVCPDDRWPAGCFSHLDTNGSSLCDIANFEVVETTTATGGPRSAGAPTVNAGPDQSVALAAGATLAGSATGSGATTWYVYPYTTPPGTVTFGNAGSLSTTASFSATGTYTLMLKRSDGIHAVAYDAVMITVVAGSPPTVANAASATPSPATGTTTVLSALGADDGGEPALTYTWATTGSSPAAVTFSANGTNAAKSSTATFTKPGTYQFQVTIKDTTNLSVTSAVSVDVNSTITTAKLSPTAASVNASATQAFTATLVDQFGVPQYPPSAGAWAWTLSGAPSGTAIDGFGLLTAGSTIGGPFTITATWNGSVSGTAQASVVDGTVPSITSAGAASGSVGTAFTYTITASNTPTGFSASGLPPGLTRSGAVISGTPTTAGSYAMGVGASNAAGTGLKMVAVTIAAAGGGGGGGGSGSGGKCGGGLAAVGLLLVGFALIRSRAH